MFCKFGSLELSRPVAATTWLNEAWTRPVSGQIISGRASTYVLLSFAYCRYWRILAGRGWSGASSSSTSASVLGPVLAVCLTTGSFNWWNSSSWSCFGEAMLNRRPANS